MHLQEITNQLPVAFPDIKRVTKSYIQATNAPVRIEISKRQSEKEFINESKARLKRGDQSISKIQILRKEREQISMMIPM